jgi:hypothetical protein
LGILRRRTEHGNAAGTCIKDSVSKRKKKHKAAVGTTKQIPTKNYVNTVRFGARAFWTLITALATLGGLYVLWPRISNDPSGTQNPRNPFVGLFEIQNNSIYPIQDIHPSCAFLHVEAAQSKMYNNNTYESYDNRTSLDAGEKMTASCHFEFFGVPARNFGALQIAMMADYKVFGLSRCKAVRFIGRPVSDGTYIWTHDGGSTSCKKAVYAP